MLRYIQKSDSKNAVDEATREIDYYVSRVKSLPEVEAGYMTMGDWIDGIKEEMEEELRKKLREEITEEVEREVTERVEKEITEGVEKEVREKLEKEFGKEKEQVTEQVREQITQQVQEQNIKIVIETFQEYHDTKENAVIKIRNKFPEYAQRAEELVEKYWSQNIEEP